MNIFLVRHGESVQNTNLFDCDFIDKEVPLTIKGINQASRLNVVFRKISKDLNLSKEKTIILSSDYHRAETTKELMNAHPNKIKDVGSDPRIREQSWGLCGSSLWHENFTKKELDNMIKEYEADRYYYSFPGGESAYDMEENRVKGFVKDLNKLDNENIIIVSHGITIKTITKVIMNYDVRWFDYEYNCKNASVRHLILSKQGNIDNGYIHGGTSHPNKTLVRK